MAGLPGGLSASMAAGSDDSMYCKLCPTVKATAYCLRCKMYLCPRCTRHHKIIPDTASHKILEGDKFPSFYASGHGEDVRQCPDHPNEEIKLYCPSHDALCCFACNDPCTKHYIPQISNEFHESSEYTKLTEEFQSSEDKIKDFFKEIDTCLTTVESINTKVFREFTIYKAQIMAYIDQREKELLAELKTIRDRDTAALEELKSTAKTIQADLREAHTKLRLHEDNSHDLFIATKRVQALLTKLKTSLDDIANKPYYHLVDLHKDPVAEKLLANEKGLAQVISTPDMSTAVFKQQDLQRWYGLGYIQVISLVSSDYILLFIKSTKEVQLVNTRDGRVLSEVSVTTSSSWAHLFSSYMDKWYMLSLIRKDRAAVAFSNKVQFINIQGQSLTLGTVLKLNHDPRGVSRCGKSDLVVSYNTAPWLEVISPDGSVRHQFHQNGTTSHFKSPDYLTTSVDGYIYVSDSGTKTITKLNSSLQMLQTFSDPLLSAPRDMISISPDQLLVCSCWNYRIVLLNTSTGKSSILLGKQDGIDIPWSLCYCHEQEKLYVTQARGLKVYIIL